MDIFGGSGTTGEVAVKHRRKAILVDKKPEYVAMQRERTANTQVELGV